MMGRVENESCEFRESGRVGSNHIASLDVEAVALPLSATATTKPKDFADGQDHHNEEPAWRKFLKFVGPGFLVSLAYLDPGNSSVGDIHRIDICSHNPVVCSKSGGIHSMELGRDQLDPVRKRASINRETSPREQARTRSDRTSGED
ncbi:hypothetical protein Nepgr_002562 [Nepenthes gracilis]|uniref:Uncharacterized protein n=1 Tax=Nepenthes gracilis TaxID=150966 RepID=A0AAD3RYB6_NEPGR|nr:hypothetical protein Nepgr_002562 [Nepenthes gracilis]